MTDPLLTIAASDRVATVTLNRSAKRNALSRELLRTLRALLADFAADGMRAVVLAGAGGCFSAGADLAELDGTAGDIGFDDTLEEVVGEILSAPYLVLAAVEGACVGAAFDLACACDARVVSSTAFFELPSVRLGLLYNPTAIARLHRLLPPATMRRLLLLGERIPGRDAVAAGIANKLVDETQAVSAAQDIARSVVANPRALCETKRLLRALDDGGVDLAPWQALRKEMLGSAERRTSLAAAKSRLRP